MRILTGLIHVYKVAVSPWTPAACRFEPTCSSYALEAVERHGARRGGWLALRRIARCQPWGGLGYDPVPLARDTARPGRADRSEAATAEKAATA